MSATVATPEEVASELGIELPTAESVTPAEVATDDRKKRGRKSAEEDPRPVLPILVDAEGKPLDIKSLDQLDGFDLSQYKPLKRSDFYEPACYYDWRASVVEQEVAKLREKAAELRKLGSAEAQRAKTVNDRKITSIQNALADLAAQGLDVAALLAQVQSKIQTN